MLLGDFSSIKSRRISARALIVVINGINARLRDERLALAHAHARARMSALRRCIVIVNGRVLMPRRTKA